MTDEKRNLLESVHREFFNIMLNDFAHERLNDIVIDDVMGYGTTIDEKIFDLGGLQKLTMLQKEQAKDIEIHISSNPVHRKITDDGNVAIYVDEVLISMEIADGTNEFNARISTILEFQDGKWKIIHWHGSKPVEIEGDTWHKDEWKQKNEALQKLVDEKTLDLENKNYELEIEAALERVRAVAMSMQNSDDLLDVCYVISEQLVKLNVENIRNVQLAIINEQNKTYSNYQFFTAYSKRVFEEVKYEENPASIALVREMKKSTNSFFIGSIQGNEYIEFRDWRKRFNQFPDPIMDDLAEVFYYFYSIGEGGLGLTTYKAISDSQLEIYKRFHLVFKLAYSRFLDLQKAEAQAKEAEIQLALERVRARTMAMQKSEELLETVSLISTQLKELGEEIDQITIGVFKEDENLIDFFGTLKGELLQTLDASIDQSSLMSKLYKAWEAGNKSLMIELSGEELINYNKWRNNYLNKDIYPIDNPKESWFVNAAMFSNGILGFSSDKPVSRGANELLERFAAVFNLTYTRFLDLKKAEAQAREAQIETGLERARAQSMMMQHSNELNKTCQVFHEQVQLLGIESEFSYLWLPEEDKKEHVFWATWQENSSEFKNKLVSYPLDKSDPAIAECYVAWESDDPVHINSVKSENVASYFNDWIELLDGIEKFKPKYYPDGLYYVDAYMKYGCFGIMTKKLLTKDEKQILHRFSNEFERAYTRFLDLKKAEEQAREAQVEAALERVRSRSIGMRSSEELADISFELVKQVLALGIDNWFCAFNIYDNHPDGSLEWGSNAQGTYEAYRTPREGIFQKYYEAGQNGETLLVNEINEKECSAHYDYLCSLPGVGQQLLAMKEAGIPFPKSQIDHVAFFKYGYVLFITFEHIPSAHHIFTRFAKVFEQSYTRFIDLKKAEEQAHEVKIELSLERIRAQVTVMQESSDLFDIVVDMRKEFLKLGHEADYFWYMHYSPDSYEMSMTSEDGSRIGMVITIPRYVHQNIPGLSEWENSDEPTYVLALDAEGAWDYIDNINKHGHYKQVDPNAPSEEDIRHLGGLTFILARTTHGEIGFSLSGFVENPPQDALDTLARFAGVFDLAYRRFEDLKSAERQNRETQIELSLERIRSKVTAMQESVELLEIVVSMRHEFVALGHEAHYFWFMNYLPDTYEKAMTSGDGSQIGMVMTLPRHIHGDVKLIADWEKSQEPTVVYAMETEEAVDYVEKMITLGDFKQVDPQAPTLDDIRHIQGLTFIMARTTQGEIGFSLPGCVPEPPQEALDTLVRFAAVFDLAYRRFEDLKSAERQNRETQIELSLERVRASAMAMQKPEDLSAIARTIYTEFKSLDFESMRNTEVVINNYENETVITYHYSDYGGIEVLEVNYKENPIVKKWAEDLKKAEDAFVPVSIPESEIKSWDQYRLELGYQSDPKMADAKGVHYYSYSTGVGALSVSTWHVLSEEQIKILARFRNVFNLAYKRYADISFAKSQAREAVKRASLDRVRGQIASMRRTRDLEQITPLIWNELQILDVPFFRCGVLIVDEAQQEVNFYLSNPQGEALAVIDLPFYSSKLTKNVVSSWKKKKVLTDHWDKEAFLNWSKSMLRKSNKKNSLSNNESEEAPESLDLHFIPFAQGMLYVGNSEPLSAQELELVESLAQTFSFGFARYQDFVEMEKAKKSLEKTLNDLKATQSQLIHAEKMASLGELTAGIAHEIQNPLNFVNNFAEVSADLIEELNEELQKGDLEEVKAIAEDLIQNLEKITNHGKRASSIVKGMLEHSRTGSGEKLPTDLNILADEYLRLAYHGLRAKNKSFNADFKMIADAKLPHLNIVPQDIGRVLLNLINNAFYAVAEKAQESKDDYKPQVVVSTAQLDNGIEIRVKDNGNGIPDKVKEKIFQPFFTTKPTGQGTGLGLSMSYDIITKGHGGNIEVFTESGKSTEFIIQLPKYY